MRGFPLRWQIESCIRYSRREELPRMSFHPTFSASNKKNSGPRNVHITPHSLPSCEEGFPPDQSRCQNCPSPVTLAACTPLRFSGWPSSTAAGLPRRASPYESISPACNDDFEGENESAGPMRLLKRRTNHLRGNFAGPSPSGFQQPLASACIALPSI